MKRLAGVASVVLLVVFVLVSALGFYDSFFGTNRDFDEAEEEPSYVSDNVAIFCMEVAFVLGIVVAHYFYKDLAAQPR